MEQPHRAFQEFERTSFNAVAPAYAAWAADKTTQVLPALLEVARLAPGLSVLDVATGPGFAAAAAAGYGAKVVGIDVAEAMIEQARAAYPGIDFRVGAAEDVPLEDESVDVVLSSFGLPHFADHDAAFGEFRRVLRPGGRLAMSTWAPPDRNPFMNLAFGGVVACGDPTAGSLPPGESPFAFADPDRCLRDLQRAGFDDVSVFDVALTFSIEGTEGMMEFLSGVGSRSKALFDAQSAEARRAIRAFIAERIAPLDLAQTTGSPTARIIASYVAGIAWSAHEPDRAIAAFSEVHEIGAKANYQNLLVGLAGAHSAVLSHQHDPTAALRVLEDALRYFAEVKVPFGLRRLIRDYLPVFENLACHEVVATLDGAAAPLSIRPAVAAHAVERARRAIGSAPYQATAAIGRAMSDATLEDYLRAELHRLAR